MRRIRRHYLGVDTGATKTHALITDEDGHVLGTGLAGSGNWEGVGLEGAHDTYAQAMGEALAAAGLQVEDLSGGGYALAGLDFPSDEARLRPVVERLGVPGPQVLVNDTFGALRAGARDGVGVVVIAGTGTTVAGCNRRGERFRTFGEGPNLGDLGGAGDLVSLAVRAVAQAYTGRGHRTMLTERFLGICGLADPLQLIEGFCRGQIDLPDASLAPLLFDVAGQGDGVALEILRYAGGELGANAAAIAMRLGLVDEPFRLVLAGGVFRSGSELLLDVLLAPVRAVAPGVQPALLETAPVAGSALLAMDADGLQLSDAVQQRLADEACIRLAAGADAAP